LSFFAKVPGLSVIGQTARVHRERQLLCILFVRSSKGLGARG
jgi:hypothetical protein